MTVAILVKMLPVVTVITAVTVVTVVIVVTVMTEQNHDYSNCVMKKEKKTKL